MQIDVKSYHGKVDVTEYDEFIMIRQGQRDSIRIEKSVCAAFNAIEFPKHGSVFYTLEGGVGVEVHDDGSLGLEYYDCYINVPYNGEQLINYLKRITL